MLCQYAPVTFAAEFGTMAGMARNEDNRAAAGNPTNSEEAPASAIVPADQPRNFLFCMTEDGRAEIRFLVDGQTCWMTQKQMADLFETSVPNINIHIRNIFQESELREEAVIKD